MDSLDLLKKIRDFEKQHEEVFGTEGFLDDWIDDLWDIILKEYNIPEDTTTNYSHEEIEKFVKTGKFPKEYYCRDYFYDLLYDFGEGIISKKEFKKRIKS